MTPEQVDRGAKGLTSLLSDLGIDTSKDNDFSLGKGESNQNQPKTNQKAILLTMLSKIDCLIYKSKPP